MSGDCGSLYRQRRKGALQLDNARLSSQAALLWLPECDFVKRIFALPLRPELSQAVRSSVEFPADLGDCIRIVALSDDSLIGSYDVGGVHIRRHGHGFLVPVSEERL